ncbi:hypothetical protein SAMN04487996_10418 [Dyadobacter soli]|uniref:Uncharacterized protein n=1 Tax=Dyadobacter soli TaxID=659014 RepID=A0A1G7B196_9BACT|nr:hypothetical protein SAMN04487996_10418 [Dyadobacter soli]
MKGDYNDEYYRTACNSKPATYYNHSTEKHYCTGCAHLINLHNAADGQRLFGHDLCLLTVVTIQHPFYERNQSSTWPGLFTIRHIVQSTRRILRPDTRNIFHSQCVNILQNAQHHCTGCMAGDSFLFFGLHPDSRVFYCVHVTQYGTYCKVSLMRSLRIATDISRKYNTGDARVDKLDILKR